MDKKAEWIGGPDEPLQGFSWKSGPHRHTTGIVMWSDVFLTEQMGTDGKNEKIAIFLVDTQGLFDSMTSSGDNSRIFALGTLLSSVQIFNLNGVVQENQLEYLHMATEYAMLVTNNSVSSRVKPFQNLLFLFRDWPHKANFKYGLDGGNMYLGTFLQPKPGQNVELRNVRKYISTSFDNVNCFLMPHPGLSVTTDQFFDGRHSKLDNEFKSYLKEAIQFLLLPENLVKKRILNNEITAKEFRTYVKTYFETFQSPQMPKIQSLYVITTESQIALLADKAFAKYKKEVESQKLTMSDKFSEAAAAVHKKARQTVIDWYNAQKKMGSKELVEKFKLNLLRNINAFYEQWFSEKMKINNHLEDIKRKHELILTDFNKASEDRLNEQNRKHEAENLKLKENVSKYIKLNNEKLREKEEAWNQQVKDIRADNDRIRQQLKVSKIQYEKKLDDFLAEISQEIRKKTELELKKFTENLKRMEKQAVDKANADRKILMDAIQKESDARLIERQSEDTRWKAQDVERKKEIELLRKQLM